MNSRLKFLILCIVLLSFNLTIVSACENLTSDYSISSADGDLNNSLDTPVISINTSEIYTGDSISIFLKDSNNTPLINQNLTAEIDNNQYNITTDSQGKSSLNLKLKSNAYLLNVIFKGNENYSHVNQTFNINILKLNSFLTPGNTTVIKEDYFYVYFKDQRGNAIGGGNVEFTINGKSYAATTNAKGQARFKVSLNPSLYSINIQFSGNEYYNSVSQTLNLLVPSTTSIVIGNSRLLTNGYLRIYLKSPTQSVVSKKTLIISIGSKKFTKQTNSEGVIVFKPKVGTGQLSISVEFKGNSKIIGSSASKHVSGIKGNVKNPLKKKIPLRNGLPDVDLMPANYVMGDGDMSYTLTKVQYSSVIKRDSYCLFLNNKLSKYTFFKSKSEPKLNHILKREKWNVIERAINTIIVKKNKNNYWPAQITVSLEGKEYTYSEVRDKQNTEYTCAPTSASMCSQVLRNYICEKQFAKQAGTISGFGTKCPWIKKALEKNHFKCSYFSKKTYNNALKRLSKGGCALIFHANNHYVAILDISKDGKKVLLSNSYGRYDAEGASLPNKWLNVNYVKSKFCSYDQRSLIVKLNYNLKKSTKKTVNTFYSSMGTKWNRQNTSERILDIGL